MPIHMRAWLVDIVAQSNCDTSFFTRIGRKYYKTLNRMNIQRKYYITVGVIGEAAL